MPDPRGKTIALEDLPQGLTNYIVENVPSSKVSGTGIELDVAHLMWLCNNDPHEIPHVKRLLEVVIEHKLGAFFPIGIRKEIEEGVLS